MVPNLNKLKFTKLHRKKRIINLGKGKKGKSLELYSFGAVLTRNIVIKANQFDSVKKFISKKLKFKERVSKKNIKGIKSINQRRVSKKKLKKKIKEKTVIFRRNFNLGLTKKPLQVRMGKGKGAPVDWVYPFAKNRIFFEFISKKFKLNKLNRVFSRAGNKIAAKLKIIKEKKRMRHGFKFKKFPKKCVKEL